jgi:branched-chain amino acid transport system ATP-binding protein
MKSAQLLLEVVGISKHFGGFRALNDVNLEVRPGERIGLIGPNGSGKTTLASCIAGIQRCDAGTLRFDGNDVTRIPTHRRIRLGLAWSSQIPRPFTSMTVLDNLRVPLVYAARANLGSVKASVAPSRDEAIAILRDVGLDQKAGERSGALTQVDLRKLELARAIATSPKLLIADEAMAGLSSCEVDDILMLLLKLKERGIAVLMIEHIMRAVMKFSDRIVVLVAGSKVADGVPATVMAQAEVQRAYLGE